MIVASGDKEARNGQEVRTSEEHKFTQRLIEYLITMTTYNILYNVMTYLCNI